MTSEQPAASNRPRYGPADGLVAPRYTGPRTFARCPFVQEATGVDVAIVGVPFDTATSYRTGARFGPEAIRSASALLRPYHPTLDVDVFAGQSVVDWGDVAITPGNAERSAGQIAEGLSELVQAGVTPIVLGGDHSIVLGELRAHAAKHGPLALVLLDAHTDMWDVFYGTERYFHGTPFRRALEEGLIDPTHSVIAGMRGPLYSRADIEAPAELGFTVLRCDELRSLSPQAYGQKVRATIGGCRPFLSFDIDVIDPTYAPATGVPEIGGLTVQEATGFVRALAGAPFCGFDVVEVSPPYDGPGQVTALTAAAIAYDFLAISALAPSEQRAA